MTTDRQGRRPPPPAGKQSGAAAETSQDATCLGGVLQRMADPQGTTLFQAYERMCSAVPGHACACPDLGAGCPLQLDQGASSQQEIGRAHV